MSFVRIHLHSATFFSQFLTPHTQSRHRGAAGQSGGDWGLGLGSERQTYNCQRGKLHLKCSEKKCQSRTAADQKCIQRPKAGTLDVAEAEAESEVEAMVGCRTFIGKKIKSQVPHTHTHTQPY